jgi:4-methylaminobutanoate oxidase (formaldehyde-forming)
VVERARRHGAEGGRAARAPQAGCHALDALRIEAGRRALGAELGPDETPFEAGLAYAVSLDKLGFVGREALLATRGQPLRKKLVTLVLDDPAAYPWGGETVAIGGEPVGELSSAGWGWATGRCVALGSHPTVDGRRCVRGGRQFYTTGWLPRLALRATA